MVVIVVVTAQVVSLGCAPIVGKLLSAGRRDSYVVSLLHHYFGGYVVDLLES